MKDNASTHKQSAKISNETPSKPAITMVGIGASAGGLEALKEFFRHVPECPDVSFVIVMHLSPDYESHLAELIQPHSKLSVEQVTKTIPLKPNCVYVIPPKCHLESFDTHLHLSKMDKHLHVRTPIDHFFRTLAETHEGHSVGILLSGTGSDGTQGLRWIKDHRGLTIVQSPDEAEYDGMPRNAIVAGNVDLVLPVADMPKAVIKFAQTSPKISIVEDDATIAEYENHILQQIFAHIRANTGHNFSRYKRSTIMRRIERRMHLNNMETLTDYLKLLREHREEVKLLFDDLLITVTEFFRDTKVFEHLQNKIIPEIFSEKQENDKVRVWSIGCATGEEVYSLAILLTEEVGKHIHKPQIQIFATDLHEKSLAKAREGLYPGSIEANVSPHRLQRFFDLDNGGYRVKHELREMIVFAPHNLLKDPPFSRLDMIVCRNMLIYFQRDMQEDVVSVLHYSLNPNGLLVLGTSESVESSELFFCENKTYSIYRRRNIRTPDPHLPVFPFSPTYHYIEGAEDRKFEQPKSIGALHAQVVEQYAPPSVLVTKKHDVVHYSVKAGKYLKLPGGEPTRNIFKLVDEKLRLELRTVIHTATIQGEIVQSKPVPILIDGQIKDIVLQVRLVRQGSNNDFFLVIFNELAQQNHHREEETKNDENSITVKNLEAELELTKQRLQTVIDEYETSQEDMQAANEELQSANEELHSAMEELETSKEELQSMNEELSTLNQENYHRVEELRQLSTDLQNLLKATDIATLFLDRDLRIVRFTPKVNELFNVRNSDKGRPLSDLTHRLGDAQLQKDAIQVLQKLIPVSRELQGENKRWYLLRILPYRTDDDRIEGVVVTLIDITERHEIELNALNARDELEKQKIRLQYLARELSTAEQRERKRLASVLHDDLQQYLVALNWQLGIALKQTHEKSIADSINQCLKLLQQAMASSKNLTRQLRPPVLYEDGLIPALQWLANEMQKRHGIEITIETEQPECCINDDMRAMVFESVRELLLNVVKHAGVKKAEVRIDHDEQWLYVSVTDHGQGCALENNDNCKKDSSGLGLFSIRERIQAFGGDLDIDSKPGEGTHISLKVPVKTDVNEPKKHKHPTPKKIAVKSKSPVKRSDAGKRRVLVVDDQNVVRQGLTMLIGYDERIEVVGQAADGLEAIREVERLRPDVVLMDVNMPNMNGIEATRQIHDQWPNIRIVGLSVQSDEATIASMRKAGADAFVSKSEDAETMVNAIMNIVSGN